ncbi:MAG: hypothetical protein ACE5KZ_10405 [Candidatus Scalinduaceae bacterium]
MEKEFINQIMQDAKGSDFGSKQHDLQIWYNQEGDCIHFKTMHVATIRKRIDEYLTLYLSIEDKKPIGFQLKDIHALFNVYDMDLMAVQADYTSKDKRLVSITTLMLKAFAKIPSPTINRFSGYSDAFRTIPKDADKVEIPIV